MFGSSPIQQNKDKSQPGPGLTDQFDTSGKNFPHEKIRKLWSERIKFATDATKDNLASYKQAEDWYRGGKAEWKFENADDLWNGPRVSANAWHRIVNILISFLSHSDPRILLSASKGEEFEASAKSLEKMAQTIYREMKYRDPIKLALLEALFRNRSYVFQGWDSYRWMPSLRWCSEEVYLDPDANGDMKQAGWIAEEYTARLEDLLDDPEITDEVKKELREKKDLHVRTRAPGDAAAGDEKSWDKQPGFTKVIAYRVYSREGLLPGRDPEEKDAIEPAAEEPSHLTNPHAAYKVEADKPDDSIPEAQGEDPIDKAGRRVQILLVKGMEKVVKVSKWHMDHFDRDEFPYIRLQFNTVPGDADGVSMFESLRPLFIAKNAIISFALQDAKVSAQRRILYDEQKIPEKEEQAKVFNGKHLEGIKTRGGNSVEIVEFSAKNPQHLTLLPEIDNLIDETSGVNDAIRGQTGDTEKTKAEAMMLHDQATAALAYLLDPIERFHEEVARYTVMAAQRFIRRETVYVPCATCGGTCPDCEGDGCEECAETGEVKGIGQVPSTEPADMTMGGAPMVTCSDCKGTGVDLKEMRAGPYRKGADWWLSKKDAAEWSDGASVEQIRAEVEVTVEPGSTRRDYRERRVGILNSVFDRFGPMYNEMGLWRSLYELQNEVILSTELPNAETIAPRKEEFQAVAQKIQQTRDTPQGPPPPPPPGPTPEELQIEQQKVQLQAQQNDQKNQIDEKRLALEQAKTMAEIQDKRMESARAAIPPRPEPVDPIREFEVSSKAENDRAKLSLEARKLSMEEAEMHDASKKFAEMVAGFQASLASMQKQSADQSQALAQQLQQANQLSDQTAQTVHILLSAAQGVQKATAGIASALSNSKESDSRVISEIEMLKKIMSAPVKVVRDASGKVQGGVRELNVSAS